MSYSTNFRKPFPRTRFSIDRDAQEMHDRISTFREQLCTETGIEYKGFVTLAEINALVGSQLYTPAEWKRLSSAKQSAAKAAHISVIAAKLTDSVELAAKAEEYKLGFF